MRIPSKFKFWRYPLVLRIRYCVLSFLRRDAICLSYWINANVFLWSSKIRKYNWGDYINMEFANLISHKPIVPATYHVRRPIISMIGSVLQWTSSKDTIIWGSGCLNSKDEGWSKVEKPLRVCAVRGPLTREVLLKHGIDCPPIYGDPVLLFPRYYTPPNFKSNKIGIIPHVSSITKCQNVLST